MNPPAARSRPGPLATELYDLVTGDEDARVCKDIPDAACRVQPENFFVQLGANAATKIGDELASPKLVLAWLLATLGAPAYMAGFLVPLRQAGALLPQLLVAAYIRRAPVRKWFWVVGSVAQGLCVLLMALVALQLDGATAGWLILALLTAFSLARGMCSVAFKDVMGKTVSKTRRGTLMGYAAACAGVVTVLVGAYLRLVGIAGGHEVFVDLLVAAGMLWLLAAAVYALLREVPGATSGGGNAGSEALRSLHVLGSDHEFRRYVVTRALLLSTALSMPFYVVLARQHAGGGIGVLGLMIIASGLGGSLSAPIWGRLADRSSRLVLTAAALLAAGLGFLLPALTLGGSSFAHSPYTFAGAFLFIGFAHGGVRIGRKTYLLDLATGDNRAAYVAVSNTLIGALLLLGGGFGFAADFLGTEYAIVLLAMLAAAGAVSAWIMPEVE